VARKLKVLIAGGGIGGLTAGISLCRAGFDVAVYEQAAQLAEVGAGIQLSANATRVLHDIGLGEGLAEVSVQPLRYEFKLFNSGEVLQEIPLGDRHEQNHGAPYYQIHRADFLNLLADRAQAVMPSGMVHLGKKAIGFAEDDDGVTLNFADGSSARGDVLIGADGIRSTIRNQIVGEAPVDYSGQVAWRINVPTERLPKDFMEHITEIWVGPNKHGVVYFLRRGEILNFVGCVDHAEWSEESWTQRYPHAELKADFAGWHQNIQTILDAADPNECYRWALNNRVPVRNWRTQRAVIMGDAAHPTLPYMAQGAVMAIEDGAVLTRALQSCADVTDALELFQQSRVDRTARIVTESNANKKLFHLKSEKLLREAFAARDMNAERSKWLFSYDALNVELGAPV